VLFTFLTPLEDYPSGFEEDVTHFSPMVWYLEGEPHTCTTSGLYSRKKRQGPGEALTVDSAGLVKLLRG